MGGRGSSSGKASASGAGSAGSGDTKTTAAANASGMQGTEKQIKFATDIKNQVENEMSLVIPQYMRDLLKQEVFPTFTDSKFWIDNAQRIREGLMRLNPKQTDREFAQNMVKTVNWMFEQAIKINPALERYRNKR